MAAYDAVRGGVDREFSYGAAEIERNERYGELAATLHVDLHEVIGHGSGQIEPGVGPLHETLKNYGSTLEEARADLVALYFAVDPKLVELGLMPSVEVGYADYDRFIRNGAAPAALPRRAGQGPRRGPHAQSSAHCAVGLRARRARQRHRKAPARRQDVSSSSTTTTSCARCSAQLLRELQRIKSTGDYAAIRDLVERYGVKVDRATARRGAGALRGARRAGVLRIHRPAPRAGASGEEDRRRADRVSRRTSRADARVRGPLRVSADLELDSPKVCR